MERTPTLIFELAGFSTGWLGLEGLEKMTFQAQKRFSSNELEFWWFLLIPLCLPQSAIEGWLGWLSFFL